jgi:hypothetical protein
MSPLLPTLKLDSDSTLCHLPFAICHLPSAINSQIPNALLFFLSAPDWD